MITRAREKCIVFSNFTAKDLNIDEKASRGLRALKTFLAYAETKKFDSISAPLEDSDSPFEDSVYEFREIMDTMFINRSDVLTIELILQLWISIIMDVTLLESNVMVHSIILPLLLVIVID